MAFPSLQEIVMSIPGVLMGLTFHEFGHAWVATKCGDDTPRLMGRVTLNPLAHLDPIGTLLLFLGGFGWAKPVQVNVNRLRPRVWGDVAVSLAGVAMNFLLALVFYVLLVLIDDYHLLGSYTNPVLMQTLAITVWMQVILVSFNIIPLPPLDGFHVARYLLPRSMDGMVDTMFRFGPMVLILFVMSGYSDRVLRPIVNVVLGAVQWIVHLVL